MSSLPLPAPPTGNRFALVTPDDNSAPIIIVTILSLTFSVLVYAIRLLIVKRKRHGYDDGVLGLGHLVGLGQWTAMFMALQNGLGKSLNVIDRNDQTEMARALFAGRTLFIPLLCFSKVSILLIIRSLFFWESRRKKLLIDSAIVFVIVWGLGATLGLSISCSPYYVLGDNLNQCSGHVLRLRIVMILDIVTECIIFGLPQLFLYTFEIDNSKKLLVIAAFAFRLPLAAFSTMYLLSSTSYIESHSTGTAIVPTIVWQEIVLGYSLMSATIPCLKSFVESFTTGGVRHTNSDSERMPYESEGSYELGWLKKTFQNKTEKDENISAPVRNSFLASRRLSGMRRTAQATSMSSQASEQVMIGVAM
ncbi:hypothetical protein EG329_008623 [Mollisiaceae sp. DMI_Dod_QoI]|nr:hypothetical protein EG329_008623 [Helotiales sp. DMI_Dod_QoI]